MIGYAQHIRSTTQGRAHYSTNLARYEEMPRGGPEATKPVSPRTNPRDQKREVASQQPSGMKNLKEPLTTS
ncbi:MAG: hypothetical protein WA741_02770 [Candidatus Sulfotelmatobacter sp.]